MTPREKNEARRKQRGLLLGITIATIALYLVLQAPNAGRMAAIDEQAAKAVER